MVTGVCRGPRHACRAPSCLRRAQLRLAEPRHAAPALLVRRARDHRAGAPVHERRCGGDPLGAQPRRPGGRAPGALRSRRSIPAGGDSAAEPARCHADPSSRGAGHSRGRRSSVRDAPDPAERRNGEHPHARPVRAPSLSGSSDPGRHELVWRPGDKGSGPLGSHSRFRERPGSSTGGSTRRGRRRAASAADAGSRAGRGVADSTVAAIDSGGRHHHRQRSCERCFRV